MAEWCQECKDYKRDAYRRPELGGKILCSKHYYEALRRACQTGLVPRLTVPDYLQEEMENAH